MFGVLIGVVVCSPPARAAFTTGANLENRDAIEHHITFDDPLTTAICWIAPPRSRTKNGIVGATVRKNVPGLTLKATPARAGRAAAIVAPKTVIACLCPKTCVIDVERLGAQKVGDGGTLVIEDGTLRVEPRARP